MDNPSRRLLRAIDERDIPRIRVIGSRWLARLFWRFTLHGDSRKVHPELLDFVTGGAKQTFH